MRLALVCETFRPRGGLEGYVFELARRLAERHETHVIAARAEEAERAGVAGVRKVARLPSRALNLLWFDRVAGRVAAGLGADAVLGFGRTTRQDAHRAGGGCHAVYSRTLPVWKRWRLKNRAELWLERRLYCGGGTRLFVFNSAAVRDQVMREYGVEAGRTAVIHTAVDCGRFRPAEEGEREAARARLGLEGEGPVFLFASLEHKRKGLDALLRAWREVDARLVIAGAPLSRAQERLVNGRELAGRARFVGGGHGMETLCHAADFFAHPTRYDACANTVLQAMACGLVALVSERDGAVDHVTDGVTGFVLRGPEEPGRIAEACRRALALGEAERRRIGAAAREAMRRLTWERHVAQWEEVIARAKAGG